MSPRKNRPVLYEVIARSRGAREPIWKRWTGGTADRGDSAAKPEPGKPDAPEAEPGPPGGAVAESAPIDSGDVAESTAGGVTGRLVPEPFQSSAAESAAAEAVPALQMDKDGVVLTLSWAGVATVLVTLLLALAFAFQAGSLMSGSKTGAPAPSPSAGAEPRDAAKPGGAAPTKPAVKPDAKTDAARPAPKGAAPPAEAPPLGAEHRPIDPGASAAKPPPKTEEPKPAAPAEPDESAGAKFDFKPGYEYLIVQHFTRAQKDAAEAAEAFLKSNGIDCVLLRGRELTLVCSEAFLLKQKDAAARSAAEKQRTQLKNRVRQLGSDFAKTYGFAFDQCYTRVMKQP
ncbi:hypothetical protein RAS1_38100 [Phycisphaerae bacterium RAS1]|nr:hypothetical protein RAS1_38100 [Phycisphaerae bacterium RAS1]